jgi:hypothetical protein
LARGRGNGDAEDAPCHDGGEEARHRFKGGSFLRFLSRTEAAFGIRRGACLVVKYVVYDVDYHGTVEEWYPCSGWPRKGLERAYGKQRQVGILT